MKKNRIGGVGKNCGQKRTASRVLGGKPEGKRPFGRTGPILNMLKLDLTSERYSVSTVYI